MIKSRIVSFGCSGLLTLALTPIGMLGHDYKLVVVAVAFALLTYWRLRTSPQQYVVTILMTALPIILIFGPLYIFPSQLPLISLPSTLFHFIGIAFGTLLFGMKAKRVRIILMIVFFFITISSALYGYPMWIHKIAYNTFTGKVLRPQPEFEFKDETGKRVTGRDFENKVVIIDFWTTSCGICFVKFPQVEELYIKIKNNPKFLVLSVNVPLRGDTVGQAIQMIRSRSYSFPVLFAEQVPINKQFEFNAYPTVFILKNDRIVFCGDIENVDRFLESEY